MTREWRSGDVAASEINGKPVRLMRATNVEWVTSEGFVCSARDGLNTHTELVDPRPLAVIDPEDRAAIEHLRTITLRILGEHVGDYEEDGFTPVDLANALQAAFRALIGHPTEPTDPKACVTDRRDNVWRLLADGEWVCTSGPDIGEYLAWDRLASERGPLEVEA